jgi:aryl-alcohol dehydrogenase-like predicted oxidoreductase
LLPSAGYTFTASHPAVATVLTGTNDPVHLEQNIAAACAPMLSRKEIDRLRESFY